MASKNTNKLKRALLYTSEETKDFIEKWLYEEAEQKRVSSSRIIEDCILYAMRTKGIKEASEKLQERYKFI